MHALTIIRTHPRFVVIDKPAGLLSVPGKGEAKADCAVARVRAAFPDATGPLVVHRLDMDTSGLLLVALDADAQRDLSIQFERRAVSKRYLALLDAQPEHDAGEIDLPIRADLANRPVQVVDFVQGRPSRTRYRVLARETDRARVEFEPITGRSHQLRLHAAAPRFIQGRPGGLGCPIQGDVLYGRADSAPRLMLHATFLAFREPGEGKPVTCESPAPF